MLQEPMDLCASVSEYLRDGEGAGLPELCRLSYTSRYISLAADSARGWGLLRTNGKTQDYTVKFY